MPEREGSSTRPSRYSKLSGRGISSSRSSFTLRNVFRERNDLRLPTDHHVVLIGASLAKLF
jgi:hypothetical protein